MARRAERFGNTERPTSNAEHRRKKSSARLNRTGKRPRHFRTRKGRIHPRHGQIWQNQNRRCTGKAILHPPSAIFAVLDVTARPIFIPDFATPRFRLTPKHFAYVKIAEGCNHPCSFCIIPRMRGSHRSRHAGGHRGRSEGADRRRREGNQSDFAGLDLLRPGFAPEPFSRAISSPEKFSAAAKSLAAGLPRPSARCCAN